MRLAWFRPSPAPSAGRAHPSTVDAPRPDDDTSLLMAALGTRHAVELIDAPRAHEFVWRHPRGAFDLCVYELGGSPAHEFVAAYAAHYPGVALLRGILRHDQALRSSRVVVVPHDPVAQALADDYPGVRIRTVVPGVEPLADSAPPVVEALRWPPDGAALTSALAGFAAARAVIVFDSPETADWPSLDPQSWRRRSPAEPICVTIDPRDEAHSLGLARRRLAADPALRTRLGAAARAWWRGHATVEAAAARFDTILEEARTLPDPPAAAQADDGTAKARRILREFGTSNNELLDLWNRD